MTLEINEKIITLLENVRTHLESSYNLPLFGKCIEGSEMICQELKKIGIPSKTVEGWCIYDDESYGSSRPYDEHTWAEINIDGKTIILDVTLDQFQQGIEDSIPRIYIGTLPRYLSYTEPTFDE